MLGDDTGRHKGPAPEDRRQEELDVDPHAIHLHRAGAPRPSFPPPKSGAWTLWENNRPVKGKRGVYYGSSDSYILPVLKHPTILTEIHPFDGNQW